MQISLNSRHQHTILLARGCNGLLLGPPLRLLLHSSSRNRHVHCQAAKVKPSKSQKASSSKVSKKGFGPAKQAQQPEAEPWEQGLLAPYRVYYKPNYKPSRYTGPIELKRFEDGSVGVISSEEVSGAELLVVSHPIAFLEGSMGTAPAVEDLHVALLEAELGPAVSKILSYLPRKPAPAKKAPAVAARPTVEQLDSSSAGTSSSSNSSSPASQQQQQQQQPDLNVPEMPPSFAHLQPSFWNQVAQQAGALVVGKLSSKQLMRLLQASCWSEEFQDPAASQVRHERPQGFLGVWPELAMLRHSCAPNSSVVVVSRYMLLHATEDLDPGAEITSNKIGSAIAAPLAARQEAHLELFGRPCRCSRCSLEATLPAEASQQLQSVYDKAQGEWPQRLQATLEAADEAGAEQTAELLAELQGEVAAEIESLRDMLALSIPSQDDQLLLLCGVYGAYDLAWQMEELLAETPDLDKLANCVALLRLFARGSESHLYTSLLYHQACLSQAEALVKQAQNAQRRSVVKQRKLALQMQQLAAAGDTALYAYTEAITCRYGMLPQEGLIPQLEQGLTLFYAGLNALSAAQGEGLSDVPELTRDLVIDGIPVTVVDTVEGSAFAEPGSEGEQEVKVKGQQQQRLRVDWLEAGAGPEAAAGVEEEQPVR